MSEVVVSCELSLVSSTLQKLKDIVLLKRLSNRELIELRSLYFITTK